MAANNQFSPGRADIGMKVSTAQQAARYGADAMEHYLFNALIVDRKDWQKIRKLNAAQNKRLFQ